MHVGPYVVQGSGLHVKGQGGAGHACEGNMGGGATAWQATCVIKWIQILATVTYTGLQ